VGYVRVVSPYIRAFMTASTKPVQVSGIRETLAAHKCVSAQREPFTLQKLIKYRTI